MKRILFGLLLGALVVPTIAEAASVVPHALGAGGGPVKLYKDCGREPMYITPAGKVWQATKGADGKRFVFQMQNIDQAQIKCLIARVNAVSHPKVSPPPAAPTVTTAYFTGVSPTGGCTVGGVSITTTPGNGGAASSTLYVCNGKDGAAGTTPPKKHHHHKCPCRKPKPPCKKKSHA